MSLSHQEKAPTAMRKTQTAALNHDHGQARCVSRVQKRTRLCETFASLSGIMWSAQSCLPLRTDQLRRLCGELLDRLGWEAVVACAHSEITGLDEVDVAVLEAETVAVLISFLKVIGSEAKGFRMEGDVVVAGDGHPINY